MPRLLMASPSTLRAVKNGSPAVLSMQSTLTGFLRSAKKLSCFLVCLIVFFIMIVPVQAQASRVAYYQVDQRYEYQHKLLQQVLEVTRGEFGEYELQPLDKKVTQKRGLKLLETGNIDLVYLAVTKDLLNRFSAITYPLQRGLLGYRLLLTQKGKADHLQENSLLEIQQNWSLGFGAHWSDLAILKHNKFKVITSVQYESLFKMLNFQRFDVFPRGITEAFSEIEKYSSSYPNMAVADGIAFYYPYPVYYFVNKQNKQLQRRLTRGLEILSNSGEFNKLFQQHFGPIISQGSVKGRKVWILDNPMLPEGISPDTSSWLPADRIQNPN